MTQPEALRLADLWEKHSRGYTRTAEARTAAELRRLHAENDALSLHLSERMKDLFKVEAQRDALLEALKMVRKTVEENEQGVSGEANYTHSYKVWTEAVREAIKAVEEEA